MTLLILSSTSQPRRELLSRLQLPFTIVSPQVDETPLPNETAAQLVERLAVSKARASANRYPQALIIGADQVAEFDNQILGKPLDHAGALQQLQRFSGNRVRFFIGVCLFNTTDNTQQVAIETFDVIFKKLSREQIENYLRKEQPYQCAGSCKAEGLGIALIEAFQGNDYTALMGLPLIRLTHMLQQAGLDPLAA